MMTIKTIISPPSPSASLALSALLSHQLAEFSHSLLDFQSHSVNFHIISLCCVVGSFTISASLSGSFFLKCPLLGEWADWIRIGKGVHVVGQAEPGGLLKAAGTCWRISFSPLGTYSITCLGCIQKPTIYTRGMSLTDRYKLAMHFRWSRSSPWYHCLGSI